MDSVKISVNRDSLIVVINIDPVDLIVSNEISILFRSHSDAVEITSSEIRVPWYEFRYLLPAFAGLAKRNALNIEFDEFARELISKASEERSFFKFERSYLKFSTAEIKQILKDNDFRRELTKQQLRDLKTLLSIRHGANFSVPGAGKTTTLLALYTILRHCGEANRLFVVAPINAFISWEDELTDIFNGKVTRHRLSTNQINSPSTILGIEAEVILVNYEKLRRSTLGFVPYLTQNKVHLVLDESHRIKSGNNNQSFRGIIQISDLAVRKDILSGTPMPQSCVDLDPQFEFLWAHKIVPASSTNLTNEQLIPIVNKAIENRFVRTTKSELKLEDPILVRHEIAMGPIQAELYNLIRSEVARRIAGLDFQSKEILRNFQKSVVRLMQAATNPMLLGANDEGYELDVEDAPVDNRLWAIISEFAKYEKSVKIEFLRGRVDQILSANQANKVVIWSYFVRNIGLLSSVLRSLRPVSIYGAVPSGSEDDETKREGIIRKFQTDKECRVLIANPQACGEGISLHKVCHNAIYLDRSFNAAHYLQSVDRIHRIGLPKGVETRIEIIESKNTMDQTINDRLEKKANAMKSVLNDLKITQFAYDPSDLDPSDQTGIDANDIHAIASHVRSQ